MQISGGIRICTTYEAVTSKFQNMRELSRKILQIKKLKCHLTHLENCFLLSLPIWQAICCMFLQLYNYKKTHTWVNYSVLKKNISINYIQALLNKKKNQTKHKLHLHLLQKLCHKYYNTQMLFFTSYPWMSTTINLLF